MSKNPFALYELPVGLSEGVTIPLAGTPASFLVRLPGTMNEDFNMELMSRLSSSASSTEEDGQMRVNAAAFQRERSELFLSTCILSAKGLPDDMDVGAFFAKYPLAKRAIYERATELAALADDEANAALGKFASLPNGSPSGEESTNNTTRLLKKA